MGIDHLIGKIHHADCMDIMKELPDKCVDLVLTDPPYGINCDKFNLGTDCHKKFKTTWDNNIPKKVVFEEFKRIGKNVIIWGGNYFTKFLEPNNNWLIWYKNNDGVSFSMCEMAWCLDGKNTKLFEYRPMGKLDKIHPTQKPVKLFTWCLSKYSKENDIIFDGFSGSGATAIACHRMNRRFICVEKDADYVKSSRERLKIEQSQMKLDL